MSKPGDPVVTLIVVPTKGLGDMFAGKGRMRQHLHEIATLELDVDADGTVRVDKARFVHREKQHSLDEVPLLVMKTLDHYHHHYTPDWQPSGKKFRLTRTHGLGPPCNTLQEAMELIASHRAGDTTDTRYYFEAHGHQVKHGTKYQIRRCSVCSVSDDHEALYAEAFRRQKLDSMACRYEIEPNTG